MATPRIRPLGRPDNRRPFHGAKAALFLGPYLVLLRRDDRPDIAWPGRLDLPGGGREGHETGWQTIRRETLEELSLDVAGARRLWARRYPAGCVPAAQSWFFVLRLPPIATGLALGDEGQGWTLLTPAAYLGRSDAVPRQQARVADYLAWTKTAPAAFTATGAPTSNW